MTKYEQPLTADQIERAKQQFVEFHGTLDICACVDCYFAQQNRCIFQYDTYNTIDDFCLMEK